MVEWDGSARAPELRLDGVLLLLFTSPVVSGEVTSVKCGPDSFYSVGWL